VVRTGQFGGARAAAAAALLHSAGIGAGPTGPGCWDGHTCRCCGLLVRASGTPRQTIAALV
jgi:hypothetical protein